MRWDDAAGHMVDEVRRQFREIKGILTGEAEPDYERCVEISTKGAQREMVVPSLIAIIAPIFTGLVFWCSRCAWFVDRWFEQRFRARYLYGKCRWCLG